MVKKKRFFTLLLVVFCTLLLVVSCKVSDDGGTTQPPPPTTNTDTPQAKFSGSGHADGSSEAFTHWDEDDPPLVATGCARCHSLGGFVEFAETGAVTTAADPGPFDCILCHTGSDGGPTRDLGSVTFDSGTTIGGLTEEAICMQCHQGRSSKPSVDSYLAARGPLTGDVVNPALSFRNIHYFAAAATLYGTHALGGYQYDGMTYDGRFAHVLGFDRCVTCHDPHSLEIKYDACSDCHQGVSGAGATAASTGLKDIRWYGSMVDYDGDGNITEGIYWELVTISEYLYNAMWSYSKDICGAPIVYEAHSYPYWFKDTNENGIADPEEAVSSNGFRLFTPRLMKAAYNYQVYQKDPGGFAHGGKYMIQLLYDSLMSINGANLNPIWLPNMTRNDEGHFNGSSEAWRHWDEDGGVQASCAKCHGYGGLADYIQHGENEETPIPNGMLCLNCHEAFPPSRSNIMRQDEVKFPSGAMLSLADNSNICLNCHQGRESKISVDNKIAGSTGPYSFTNIHYFPAAAILFGTEAKGGYEYERKSYASRNMFPAHGGDFDTCVECHMGTKGQNYGIAHNVQRPNPADCVICHGRDVSQPNPGWDPATFSFEHIRPNSTPDYDGDGNTSESLRDEIHGLEDALYAVIQLESRRLGTPAKYDGHSYPYWFNADTGGRLTFTKELLKAAYNYQASQKEPHGFIHNARYVAQLLVDSIQDLGGDVSPYTWR